MDGEQVEPLNPDEQLAKEKAAMERHNQNATSVPQPWAKLSDAEKIERLREVTHEFAATLAERGVEIGELQGGLAGHLHDENGRVYMKNYIHDPRPQGMVRPGYYRNDAWRTDPNALW